MATQHRHPEKRQFNMRRERNGRCRNLFVKEATINGRSVGNIISIIFVTFVLVLS